MWPEKSGCGAGDFHAAESESRSSRGHRSEAATRRLGYSAEIWSTSSTRGREGNARRRGQYSHGQRQWRGAPAVGANASRNENEDEEDESDHPTPKPPTVKPGTIGPVQYLKGKIVSSDCSKAPEAIVTVVSGMTTYKMHASDFKSLPVIGEDRFSCECRTGWYRVIIGPSERVKENWFRLSCGN